jgi:CPA2 family monovalent cation:H+ antiporter-2
MGTSSTLLAIRLLIQGRKMYEPFARMVIGVLLIQDLLMILLVVILVKSNLGVWATIKGLGGTIALGGHCLVRSPIFLDIFSAEI